LIKLKKLASGESSGQLAKMLNKAAQNQENEIDHYTTKAVTNKVIINNMTTKITANSPVETLRLFYFQQH
jgi:adenosylmethionine-8-amino-7-oxononanoate aminotransferase